MEKWDVRKEKGRQERKQRKKKKEIKIRGVVGNKGWRSKGKQWERKKWEKEILGNRKEGRNKNRGN